MSQLDIEILLPTRKLGSFQAKQLIVPSENGYMGILPEHTSFVSSLGIGKISIEGAGTENTFFSAGGYIEVSNNKVKCCLNVAEPSDEIDLERAKKAHSRAEKRLSASDSEVDMERARIALMKAIQRIEIAKSL